MKSQNKLCHLVALLVPILLFACALPMPQPKYANTEAKQVRFVDLDQSRSFYDFGPVNISILPYTEAEENEVKYNVIIQQLSEPLLGTVNTQYQILPENVNKSADAVFVLRVTNQMDRILRLSDTITDVRVNNNRVQTFTPAFAQADFDASTVLPGMSEEMYIGIKNIDRYGGTGQIEIRIFDIPVDINSAGQVVERANLDSIFRYAVNTRDLSVIQDNRSAYIPVATFSKYAQSGGRLFSEDEIKADLYSQ